MNRLVKFLALITTFGLSLLAATPALALGAVGGAGPHANCGEGSKCYSRTAAITWIKLKYNNKGPNQHLQYWGADGTNNIKPICGEVGWVYILVPFYHKSGDFDTLYPETGKIETLKELYMSKSQYLMRGGGQGIYEGIYMFGESLFKWTNGSPAVDVAKYGKVDSRIATLEDYGMPISQVKADFEYMRVNYPEAVMGKTWSATSDLAYFCFGDMGQTFNSKSSVEIAGSGDKMITEYDGEVTKIYTATEAAETIPVNFEHFIFSPLPPTNSALQTLDFRYTVTYTVENLSGGVIGAPEIVKNNEKLDFNPVGWAPEDNKYKRLVSVTNGRQIPTNNKNLKYCETITYKPKYLKALDGGGFAVDNSKDSQSATWRSKACVVIDAPIVLDPPICGKMNEDFDWTIDAGNSYGESSVLRARGNIQVKTSKTKDHVSIYARPGDNVRFTHCLQVGSHAVRGSGGRFITGARGLNNSVATEGIINSGGKQDLIQTHFDIFGSIRDRQTESAWTKNNKYAFLHRSIVGAGEILLKPFKINDGTGSQPVAVDDNYNDNGKIDANKVVKNGFIVYSPSTSKKNLASEKNTYNCNYGSFGAHAKEYYQIPGFDNPYCPSSRLTQASDAGKEFKQTISYNNVHAWVMESHRINMPDSGRAWIDKRSSQVCSTVNAWCQDHNETHNRRRYYNSFNDPYKSPNDTPGIADREEAELDGWQIGQNESWSDSGKSRTCCSYSYVSCGTTTCRECDYYDGPASGASCTVRGTVYINKDYDKYRYYTNQKEIDEKKSASVKVPYNYTTTVNSNIHEGTVIYLGETVSSSFAWTIKPRINKNVIETSYATVTPEDSNARFVELVIKPNSPQNVAGHNNTPKDPCEYYKEQFGAENVISCRVLDEQIKAFNGQGNYAGASYSAGFMRAVPDTETVEVGSKYCVAMGFYHTDSYGDPDKRIINGDDGVSLDGASPNWNVSGASCRTIAKKPNIQVWGEGVSVEDIRTTISKKRVGVGIGEKSTDSRDDVSGDVNSNVPLKDFGSWAEYEIIAGNRVYGMASGAVIGYGPHAFNLPGGITATTDFCRFAIMTIRNHTCGSGYSGMSGIQLSPNTLVERLKTRYAPSDTPDTGKTVATALRNAHRLDNANNEEAKSDTKYVSFSGNTNTGGKIVRNAGDGTLIIYVNGTLTIDDNICLGDGDCARNNDNTLRLGNRSDKGGNGRNTTNFSNNRTSFYGSTEITVLPQVLIIAGAVNVSQNVTQIDAWIISDRIDTCSDGDESSATCDKTLIINGPVISRNMYLNRTAGATQGGGVYESGNSLNQNLTNDGSITPAEIFNYRPDAIFWAYSQAQRFSQATVTYSRELAPRY